MNPRRVLLSLVLWSLYIPYVSLLRSMGPRPAILLTRMTSFLHWFFCLAGACRRTRREMVKVLPEIRPDLDLLKVLRQYIILKQQHFVQWYSSSSPLWRSFLRTYCSRLEGKEHLDQALERGRGAIVVFFHFGMARMNILALAQNGYDCVFHEIPFTRYREKVYPWVARAIMNRENEVQEASGRKAILHHSGETLRALSEALSQNAIIVLMGDGMAASRLVELPFLNGRMPFPTGPARLAALTGAGIVCVFSILEGLFRHRFVVHPAIYCSQSSSEAIETTVQAYVATFENYVRRYPWAWWSWRRLELQPEPDGSKRFVFTEIAFHPEKGSRESRKGEPG